MALYSTIVEFSVETGFYFILVFVSLVLVSPETRCSVTIFATFIARSLEEPALFFFPYPAFSARTFSLGYFFNCFLLTCNSVLHNQRIYLLRSLYAISEMLTLQYTLIFLYSSGKTSNTCVFVSYSYFSYFTFIFLNLKFKLYSSLKNISGSWIMSLILHVFHLFVT